MIVLKELRHLGEGLRPDTNAMQQHDDGALATIQMNGSRHWLGSADLADDAVDEEVHGLDLCVRGLLAVLVDDLSVLVFHRARKG